MDQPDETTAPPEIEAIGYRSINLACDAGTELAARAVAYDVGLDPQRVMRYSLVLFSRLADLLADGSAQKGALWRVDPNGESTEVPLVSEASRIDGPIAETYEIFVSPHRAAVMESVMASYGLSSPQLADASLRLWVDISSHSNRGSSYWYADRDRISEIEFDFLLPETLSV